MSDQIASPPDNVRPLPGNGRGTLTTALGDQLPVRTFERGQEVLLVVLVDVDEAEAAGLQAPADLEYVSVRGIVKLRGQAVLEDRSLIRFRAIEPADVTQRRSFVRVTSPQTVLIDTDITGTGHHAHTIDLSGGGMLLSGASDLDADQEVSFSITVGEGELPVHGLGRVVRAGDDDRRALVFQEIDETDRQRLIRFVFDCMRNARAKTRGDLV